tara:strand:- start:520 stop:1689 length:1170 start_codon:yes stop_codon:yes gene_type:complete
MAYSDIQFWSGSSTFDSSSGETPFGFYDTDTEFISEIDSFANWAAKKLGYPVVQLELVSGSFYACFEEAITEYSANVNQYNIKENLMKLQGAPTSSNFTHQLVGDLGRAITISEAYGAEVGVGGSVDWKTGFVEVSSSDQVYDLNAWAQVSASGKAIEIKRVFHESTPAITRYFDPYVGTGYGSQNLLTEFGWGNMTPAVTFTMMPINADLLRIQAIELNDQVRKSAYSFELINNKLRVFPIPTSTFKMYFQYILKEDRWKTYDVSGNEVTGSSTVQTDFSNVRYDNMVYSNINDPGKQWIRQFGLALVKELLGLIRSKYSSIPIPGAETTLDGETLRSEAIAEKERLITLLRDMLELASSQELMESEAVEADKTMEILRKVPLKIYTG